MDTIKVKDNDVLKRAMSLLSLSQSGLALLVGKDQATIFRYVNGVTSIPDAVFSYVMGLLQRNEIDPLTSLGIANEDQFYFHSAPTLLSGPIDVNRNKGSFVDFGHGFYLGKTLRQSSSWAKRPDDPMYIYRFRREKFANLTHYSFGPNSVFDWLCFIALNRNKIPEEYRAKIAYVFKDIETYDLVEGKIADSFSFQVIEGFFQGIYDLNQAELCSTILALGEQICLKNQDFASHLEADELYVFDLTISRYFKGLGKQRQSQQDKDAERALKVAADPKKTFAYLLKKNYGKK
jgi:hypothetical protein